MGWTRARWVSELRNIAILMGCILGMGGTCVMCVKFEQGELWAIIAWFVITAVVTIPSILAYRRRVMSELDGGHPDNEQREGE